MFFLKSRYIKFDYHDNDFGLSAIDAIQTLFLNHLFEVTPEWKDDCANKDEQIGRASCRERV